MHRAEVLGCRVGEEAEGKQGAGGGASAGRRMGVGFGRRGFRRREQGAQSKLTFITP